MKALVFKGSRITNFTDYADPTYDENGVIVKVMANGVCRSDYSMWYNENPPNAEICGHEMTGVIAEVGKIVSVAKNDEKSVYDMYADYSEDISKIASHRVLAMNRGESEKVLKVKISAPEEEILSYLKGHTMVAIMVEITLSNMLMVKCGS